LEVVVADFKVLYDSLHRRTEYTYENLSTAFSGRESKPGRHVRSNVLRSQRLVSLL